MSRICSVLQVSRSGYYVWRKRSPSKRKMANQRLLAEIKTIHKDNLEAYGSPRITQALRQQGQRCGENRVARLNAVRAKSSRRYHVTTRRNATHPAAPNLLLRNFSAQRPNQIWLADITNIPTQEGWLYLAAVLDLYSRRIIG